MLKTLALALLAALALLLIYAATRPDSFEVTRSTRIQAPPERIFGLVKDLKQFNTWNPYWKKDPAQKGEYSATVAGPGARYAWDSKEVGVGSMQITQVAAPTEVAMKLEFVKPFEAHNTARFTLQPVAGTPGATDVTWAMSGPSPFVAKLIGVVFNMDRMVGRDFEAGLADLKIIAERS